jgi:hypothetical protein
LHPNCGRILVESETLRNQADYEALSLFDADGTADLLRDVARFVQAVKEQVADPGHGA